MQALIMSNYSVKIMKCGKCQFSCVHLQSAGSDVTSKKDCNEKSSFPCQQVNIGQKGKTGAGRVAGREGKSALPEL